MQDIQNLSQLNQLYINNLNNQQQANALKVDMTQKEDTVEINGTTKTLSSNAKKKLIIGGTILAAAIAIGAAIIKRKNSTKEIQEIADEAKDVIIKNRNEINIKKGIASFDNKPFTGIIEDSVSGNKNFKYHLEYDNGVLIKSIKTQGNDVLEKTYQKLDDGTQKIVIKNNGTVSEKTLNKKALQEAVKNSEQEYKKLYFDDFNKLSSEEFNKKSQEIQYLNKKQKANLDKEYNKISQKEEKAAQIAQEQAEKAAKEAEELAQKEAQKLAKRQEILDKIKSSEEIKAMQKEELIEYEKQIHREISSIKKKYPDYMSDEAWYSAEDKELISKLRNSVIESRILIDRIEDAEKFNRIASKINTGNTATIKNKLTDEDIAITLNKKAPVNGGSYRISAASNEGNIFGLAEVSTPEYDEILSLPKDYCKNSLELKYLSGSNKSKGAGKEIIKEVVKDSNKAGYGGKVWVDACGGSLPSAMTSLAGAEKMQTSPVPFYFKQGFRFTDEAMNEATKAGIENLKKGLAYDGPAGGNMYLPQEAIEKILNS